MTDSICKEMEIRKKEFSGNYNSLYFGGGTPSVLAISEIKQILDHLSKYTNRSKQIEVTVEINPEDITEVLLSAYRELGVNRLSIGVQSLNDEILNWMNRSHNQEKAIQSILLAKKMGFENISVDFIYGVPGYPNRNIKEELSSLLSTKPFHISCYHFTIEDKTYFGHLKKQNKLKEIRDTQSEEEFKIITYLLCTNRYVHYEISNFSLPGRYLSTIQIIGKKIIIWALDPPLILITILTDLGTFLIMYNIYNKYQRTPFVHKKKNYQI